MQSLVNIVKYQKKLFLSCNNISYYKHVEFYLFYINSKTNIYIYIIVVKTYFNHSTQISERRWSSPWIIIWKLPKFYSKFFGESSMVGLCISQNWKAFSSNPRCTRPSFNTKPYYQNSCQLLIEVVILRWLVSSEWDCLDNTILI